MLLLRDGPYERGSEHVREQTERGKSSVVEMLNNLLNVNKNVYNVCI